MASSKNNFPPISAAGKTDQVLGRGDRHNRKPQQKLGECDNSFGRETCSPCEGDLVNAEKDDSVKKCLSRQFLAENTNSVRGWIAGLGLFIEKPLARS